MPNITLTVTSGQATRIQNFLASTPYPATLAGIKLLLIDYLKSQIKEYETYTAKNTALKSIILPEDLEIT
ncbi:MAG: hypothetical protein AABY22_28400 [Nanoarchaeota archaeon]